MRKWIERLIDLFKPCYIPGHSDFEQPSSEKNDTSSEGKGGDTSSNAKYREASCSKRSFFPDIPSTQDLLDFGSYADALVDLISDASTQTPLTIGILGSWGTGKSTLVSLP